VKGIIFTNKDKIDIVIMENGANSVFSIFWCFLTQGLTPGSRSRHD